MRANVLLQVWEEGHAGTPAHRTALLTRAAGYDPDSLSVGSGNAVAARLHQDLFGPAPAILDCPSCGSTLEFELPLQLIGSEIRSPVSFSVESGGKTFEVNEPSVQDLDVASRQSEAAQALARLCVPDYVEDSEMGNIEDQLATLSPSPFLSLDLACADCGHRFSEPIEMTTFVWARLHDWARSFLKEVHVLAQAYGWPESEIIELSSARRRMYLEMIAG